MKDLLEYIVKNLVSNPDAVLVEEENQDGNVNLYLTVDPADMGIVIGKGGQTIHSLRKILTVRAIAENVRVNLQLVEPEGSGDRGSTPETHEDANSEGVEPQQTSEESAQEEAENPETPAEETPQESEEESK